MVRRLMKLKKEKDSLRLYYLYSIDGEYDLIFNINANAGRYCKKEWLEFEPIIYYDKESRQKILDVLKTYNKNYFLKS